jgi:hypothetical protein
MLCAICLNVHASAYVQIFILRLVVFVRAPTCSCSRSLISAASTTLMQSLAGGTVLYICCWMTTAVLYLQPCLHA